MVKHNRIIKGMVLAVMLGFFAITAPAQPPGSYYTGPLEYSIPILTAVPPIDSAMPSDVTSAYLWADELMRSTPMAAIDHYIQNIGYDDTLRYLAKMLYRVDDYNPLTLFQWGISGWPVAGHPDHPWHYKADPDHERVVLQNHIGGTFSDTGRTGFLLACDIISDVTISDTFIKNYMPGNGIQNMVLAQSLINDEIKGKVIPACLDIYKIKGGNVKTLTTATVNVTVPDTAAAGTCLNFEYSPEWQKGVFDDAPGPGSFLSDSTGWWIKPGNEYIIFLFVAGVNGDTANGYYTLKPFWGVFGTQGAMYRVIAGHVVDPYDDFGLGGTNLTVADWKSRLRARIYNILNP